VQIVRYNTPVERSYFRPDSYAFKGPAIYDGRNSASSTSRRTRRWTSRSETAGWLHSA
jgi:hypothetical protein